MPLKFVLCFMLYLILSTITFPVLNKLSCKRDQREGRAGHLSCVVEHGAHSCLQVEPGKGSLPQSACRIRSPESDNEPQLLPGPPEGP